MKKNQIGYLAIIIVSSILLFTACKKKEAEEPIPPPLEAFSNLEWIWSGSQRPSTYYFSNIIGINSMGNVLHNRNIYGNDFFQLSDANTGAVIWSSEGEFKTPGLFVDGENFILKNDILTLLTENSIHAINAISGNVIWTQKLDTMIVKRIFMAENNELFIAYKHVSSNDKKTHIVKTNHNTLNWQPVLNIDDSTYIYGVDCQISFDKNKNGESMLLLLYNLPNYECMVYCYNLNSNKIEWTHILKNRILQFRGSQLFCYQQKLFVELYSYTIGNTLMCIDINNGKQLWENIYPSSNQNRRSVYHYNNTLVYLGDGIYCVDLETGGDLGYQKYSFDTRDLKILTNQYKNYLLFGIRNKLQIFDISKRELIYNQVATFPFQEFNSSPFVHQGKKQLYFFDDQMLHCFKMPSMIH